MTDQPGGGPEHALRLPGADDLILSTAQIAISLAAENVARRERLEDAQLAIDTADALLPLVARLVPADQLHQYRRAVAELQLAYAQVTGTAAPAGAAPPAQPQGPQQPQPPPSQQPPPAARPRPRIWTPGGEV